jgi:hypothetical protein
MDRYNSFESKDAKSTVIWRDGAVRIAERVMARSEGAMRIAKQLVNLRATGFCIRARRNNA